MSPSSLDLHGQRNVDPMKQHINTKKNAAYGQVLLSLVQTEDNYKTADDHVTHYVSIEDNVVYSEIVDIFTAENDDVQYSEITV